MDLPADILVLLKRSYDTGDVVTIHASMIEEYDILNRFGFEVYTEYGTHMAIRPHYLYERESLYDSVSDYDDDLYSNA